MQQKSFTAENTKKGLNDKSVISFRKSLQALSLAYHVTLTYCSTIKLFHFLLIPHINWSVNVIGLMF